MASAFKLTIRLLNGNILQMLFFSSLVSLIVLFIILLVKKKLSLILRVNKKNILSSMILGLLNPFIYYLILFKAYSLLPGQEAGTLNYTWPIALTLLSVPLLGQRIKIVHAAAILISFTGVMIISTKGHIFSLHFTNFTGAVLAVGSSFVWALYWIINMRDNRETELKLFMNFCFGFIFLFFLAFFTGNLNLPSWPGLIGVVWIGLFEMGITFLIWLKALELASRTSLVSNLVYLSPFLSLIFLQFVLKESILFSSVIGLVFIIAGILIQSGSRVSAYGSAAPLTKTI